MFFAIFRSSWKNIFYNRKQSFLTILGVIIGIASVITVFSVGAGAESLITNQIKNIGTNLLAVIPGKSEEGGGPPAIARGIIITTLTTDDAKKIEAIPEVEGIVPINIGNSVVTYQNNSEPLPWWGTGYRFAEISEVGLEEGRFFTEKEEQSFARVAVLGHNLKEKLFGNKNPIGEDIKVEQKNFKVIGVLETQGTQFFFNQDDYFFIPYTVAQKQILGIDYLHVLRFKAKQAEYVDYLKEQATRILRRSHKIQDPANDDFSVNTQAAALDTLSSVTSALTYFLSAIAGISLLVGGIGIMNMMLVSVTRRTKEIGLRIAIGAKKHHIVLQFLIEASLLTLIGGIVGITIGTIFGWSIALIMQYLQYEWNFVISLFSIVLATGISVLIGIIFGLYPAIKASRLNPIEALRYE